MPREELKVLAEVLDLLPVPIGIASAVLENGQYVDFELVWANHDMLSETSLPYAVGDRMSKVVPELYQSGWVGDLVSLKGGNQRVGRFVDIKVGGESQIARVELSWHHDYLIFTVILLSHKSHDRDDAIRAASIVSRIMPKLPIAYSVRGDQEQWLRFPTEGFLTNLGVSAETYKKVPFLEMLHKDDVHVVQDWAALPVIQRPLPLLFRMGHDESHFRWVELWSAKLPGVHSDPQDNLDDVVIIRDVDNVIRLQESNEKLTHQLHDQLEVMTQALDASQSGFAIWKAIRNGSGEIKSFELVYINKVGIAATGKATDALVGFSLTDVVGVEESKGLHNLFTRSLVEDCPVQEVVDINSPTGWVGAYENSVVPFGSDQVVTSFRDVSEERREHQRLVWLTEHDYLTGMPNRSKLASFLENSTERAKTNDTKLAFVFIDIDYFKNVNDTYGHDVGDALLVNFVKRIRHSLPESALVARIAGDEFAIVLEELKSREHLQELMEEVFRAMERPFNHNTPDLSITCSAGCVLTDGGEKPEEVMRLADKAMYRAKHEGRNRFLIDLRIGA